MTDHINKLVTDSPVKILLVDDNSNNLLAMEVALEQGDYVFLKATSGSEALRLLLHEEDLSLILLDVKMPIMDGYETAELIYQRDKLKDIPIIFITAHDYEEAAMFKGYQAGAVDFVRKPFNPEVLRSKVAVFAELFRKNRLLRLQEERLQAINNDLTLLNLDLEQRVLERTIELESLNHQLKSLNVSKDQFLSVLSHDLRNPFTALLIASGKLNEASDSLNPAQIKQLSGIIHRTSNKLVDQLNEVIEWAKMQSKKANFNPQRIHLLMGIEDSLELLRPNAAQKKIKLHNKTPKDIFVRADALMLRSIIQNLVTNAIKYTGQGGVVIVNAVPENKMICVFIQDTGIGMTDEMKDRLFKIHNGSSLMGTNNEPGSGLGLLLVNDFIVQHGGSIEVNSEVGKGTTFKFTIPADRAK